MGSFGNRVNEPGDGGVPWPRSRSLDTEARVSSSFCMCIGAACRNLVSNQVFGL